MQTSEGSLALKLAAQAVQEEDRNRWFSQKLMEMADVPFWELMHGLTKSLELDMSADARRVIHEVAVSVIQSESSRMDDEQASSLYRLSAQSFQKMAECCTDQKQRAQYLAGSGIAYVQANERFGQTARDMQAAVVSLRQAKEEIRTLGDPGWAQVALFEARAASAVSVCLVNNALVAATDAESIFELCQSSGLMEGSHNHGHLFQWRSQNLAHMARLSDTPSEDMNAAHDWAIAAFEWLKDQELD